MQAANFGAFPTGLKRVNLEKDVVSSDDSKSKKITRELQDALDYESCQSIKD
jgi:hypothetical protein